MTVEEFLHIYTNSVGANYGVFTERNHLHIYNHDQRENLIEDFGDRIVECFEIENESTIGLLIYLKKTGVKHETRRTD